MKILLRNLALKQIVSFFVFSTVLGLSACETISQVQKDTEIVEGRLDTRLTDPSTPSVAEEPPNNNNGYHTINTNQDAGWDD